MRRENVLNVLIGLVVISGLIGALMLARPALDVEHQPSPQAPEAAENP
ncbi:hypothetical protein [Streptomyces sp. 6N223]